METLTVATLIAALNSIGQVYRNKDASQPADAVKKLLQQLDGAAEMTLTEWVEARRGPKAAVKTAKSRKSAKPRAEEMSANQALARLERAETQADLRNAIVSIALSAADWKLLAKQVTGETGRSGKTARDILETHFSDKLLLNERVDSVKRQFSPTTPPPAAS
jgi:hypothetical protein